MGLSFQFCLKIKKLIHLKKKKKKRSFSGTVKKIVLVPTILTIRTYVC